MGDDHRSPSDPPPGPEQGPGHSAPPPQGSTAADQAAAEHGLGRLVQVREVAHRGPQFALGCVTSIGCVVLIPIVAGVAQAVDLGVVDAILRPVVIALIVGIIWGVVAAIRGLASAKERFHFYEGGLVYVRGGRIEAIPWQRMQGMYALSGPEGSHQATTAQGYHLAAGNDIALDLTHPPTGPDPFVEWVAATLRHHGRLKE